MLTPLKGLRPGRNVKFLDVRRTFCAHGNLGLRWYLLGALVGLLVGWLIFSVALNSLAYAIAGGRP